MIIVSKPSKPFEFNSKGGPRRHFLLDKYAPEIQALYATIQKSSQTDVPMPENWTESSIKCFLKDVVTTIMEVNVHDEEDLFQQGCDRHVASRIHTILFRKMLIKY